MMKTRYLKRLVLFVGVLSLMTACNDDVVNEYCNYTARLVYHGDMTPLQPLNAAINGINTFAMVSMPDNTAATYQLKAQLYGQGAEQTTVALSGSPIPTMGLDNGKGFIIGRSSMRDNEPFVFDRVCPNCYKEHRDTKYVLSFADALTVKCDACKRTYSLLNGGLVTSSNNGDKLFRYRVSGFTLNPPSITVFQ
jgi:hypothetical protein